MTKTLILDESAISEIEARANAATEGPWSKYHRVSPRGAYKHWHIGNKDGLCQITMNGHERDYDFMAHAREDIPALCATVRHLRQMLADPIFGLQELQSQLEQLRAENPRLRRTIEAPSRSDSMKIGIPQSPLCGDVNCPLHGDYPNTCVTQPVCSRGYVPPVNNTIVI